MAQGQSVVTDAQLALVTLVEGAFERIYLETDQLPVRGEAPADVWATLAGFCPKLSEPRGAVELNGIPIVLSPSVSFARRFNLYMADGRMFPV
jgi:hypothetical protein